MCPTCDSFLDRVRAAEAQLARALDVNDALTLELSETKSCVRQLDETRTELQKLLIETAGTR